MILDFCVVNCQFLVVSIDLTYQNAALPLNIQSTFHPPLRPLPILLAPNISEPKKTLFLLMSLKKVYLFSTLKLVVFMFSRIPQCFILNVR